MAQIDYYLFTLSPFCYLAGNRLEEIAERHHATITYRPFALPKIFEATGGLPLSERHMSRRIYRSQELVRLPRALGMPLNPQPAHWPTNPVPSCAAIIAAQNTGGDVAGLAQSILRACWAEEKDIAEDTVLKDCLSQHGFDPGLLDRAMLSGVETYERNTKLALDANVFGAPSYVVGDEVFWGQDRLPLLEAHLALRA